MIIKLKKNANPENIESLKTYLNKKGFQIQEIKELDSYFFGIIGDTTKIVPDSLYAFEFIESVLSFEEPYKRASRKIKPEDTVVDVSGIKVGGKEIVIIAGPCAIENRKQAETVMSEVKSAGAKLFRAGAYKPRTSPYSFQGLEQEGLQILVDIKNKHDMPLVSEITSIEDIDLFVKNVDLIQVGARNMQNYPLLKALGKINKPVLLKRGIGNTIEEWLMSAEYILAGGNSNVILCERGIRTFETSTRNTLDLSAVPVIKKLSHLPIIVDPSHGTGRWEYVEAMSLAAIAAGADGLMIEVHNDPEAALSDGQQSLKPEKFKKLMFKCKNVAEAINRKI